MISSDGINWIRRPNGVPGPQPGYGQVVDAVSPAVSSADIFTVQISDTLNTDGFLNVPLAWAGATWNPLARMSYQSTVGRQKKVNETTSRGGNEYPQLLSQQRQWNVATDGIRSSSELWQSAEELDRVSSSGGNVLFIPDTTSANMQKETVFGRLASTANIGYPAQAADRRSWQFTVTERL
jgi:hypothetical protein